MARMPWRWSSLSLLFGVVEGKEKGGELKDGRGEKKKGKVT